MGYKNDRLAYLYWSNHNPHYTQMGDDTTLDLGKDPILKYGHLTRVNIERDHLMRRPGEPFTLVKTDSVIATILWNNSTAFWIIMEKVVIIDGKFYCIPNAIVDRCLNELDRQVFQPMRDNLRLNEEESHKQEVEWQRLREERRAQLQAEQVLLRLNQTVTNQPVQHTHVYHFPSIQRLDNWVVPNAQYDPQEPSNSSSIPSAPPQNTPVEYPDEWLEEPEDSEVANLCIICADRAVATVIVDCGHMCLCVHCSRFLSQDSLEPKCPKCRCQYKKIVRTFSD